MNNFKQRSFLLFFLIFCSLFLIVSDVKADGAGTRVLFIGNSLTYANDLPQLIANLAKSRQRSMEYDMYAPGGASLAAHAADPVVLSKIKQKAWDFVVLQEQSQRPALGQSQVREEVYPFAKKLSRLIKEANPQAHIVFYMTMAKKNGDPNNAVRVSQELGTYEGMQKRLIQSYMNMGKDNRALIAPVGWVWKKVRQQYPSINLYSDETHPNLTGSYLAACVFYTVFFKDTAVGLPYPSGIDGGAASVIQKITDYIAEFPEWNMETTGKELTNASAGK